MNKQDFYGEGPAIVATCHRCGGIMRLVSSEPHPTQAGTDLHAFSCVGCGLDEMSAVQNRSAASGGAASAP